MPHHQVTKVIHFSYGHRLINYDGPCRHLHGHNGMIEIDVASDALDAHGMVIDFRELRESVKGWVDANLDHRMLLCRDDPAVAMLRALNEPMYLLDGNPTAENIAREIFNKTREHGLAISEVRLWETPSSYAVYRDQA
ncbi:MAG: 6-pyruvoyl trahydropterin synthase family protein [Gemmatimonadaceae bacterium]